MKVVFNGVLERHSKGCNCKGKVSDTVYLNTKMYILPSGLSIQFYVGKPVEVSETDGKFLLSYVYADVNGSQRAIFSKVE